MVALPGQGPRDGGLVMGTCELDLEFSRREAARAVFPLSAGAGGCLTVVRAGQSASTAPIFRGCLDGVSADVSSGAEVSPLQTYLSGWGHWVVASPTRDWKTSTAVKSARRQLVPALLPANVEVDKLTVVGQTRNLEI